MKKVKKIVFVTPVYLPAAMYGSDKYVWYLAEDFAKRGYDVTVITSNALTARYWYDPIFGKSVRNKFEVINGVKVYRLKCNFWLSSLLFVVRKIAKVWMPQKLINRLEILSNGPWLLGLNQLISQGRFDVIHTSPYPLFINKQTLNAINNFSDKPKLVVTPFFHEQVKDFGNPEIYGMFKHADVIHVISDTEKSEIIKRYPDLARKITVIPLFAVFPKKYDADKLINEINFIKNKYHLNQRRIILFVGIKGEMKGAVDLLLSVNNLFQTDKRYLLIAIGGTTPAWIKAKNQINKDCLLDIDYLDGKQKHAFYAVCDVFCMPSMSETFGLVYLEAWHKQKPVIAADIPAVRELVGLNKGGILVQYGNREKLEKTIKELSNDRAKSEELGRNGYSALMKKYSYNKLIQKYVKLFS